MASYTAIADVGETLVTLLREEMSDLVETKEVVLASPDALGKGDDVRLSLFLYAVTENPHLKNQRRQEVDATTLADVPLELDLHYTLTAHPTKQGSDETAKTKEQHEVLGRAMQVLSDNAIVRGSSLKGGLDDEVTISIETDATGRLLNVWNTFQERPYRPSVTYVVGPVTIESTGETALPRVVELDTTADEAGTEGGDG